MLNQRQHELLKELIEQCTFVGVRALADRYQVSERAIRNDLVAIEYDVKRYGLELERHKQRGARLILREGDRDAWLRRLSGEPEYSNRLTAEERLNTILGVLFRKRSPVNSSELADLLQVPRRTVAHDLKRVKEWLQSRH